MATLNSAPTPAQFATAWTRGFAKAVRDAAGTDGRLSEKEAARIAERTDSLSRYGDNAVNYLDRTGQKSVSVEKLIAKGYGYAYAVAAKEAGNGNRVSLVEARNLPDDIRGDFFTLRGKGEVAAAKLTGSALQKALDAATVVEGNEALYYISEGDYPVLPVATHCGGKIDGAMVMNQFEDLLLDGMFEDVDDFRAELTAEAFSAADSVDYMARVTEDFEGMDDYYRVTKDGFRAVMKVFAENLTDMTVVKVGEKDDDGSLAYDSGLYAYFVLGRTEDGKVAGVYYGSVET